MFALSSNDQLQLCRLYQRAMGIASLLDTGDVKLLSSFRERNLLSFLAGEYVGNEDLIISLDQCVELTFFEGKLYRFFVVKV